MKKFAKNIAMLVAGFGEATLAIWAIENLAHQNEPLAWIVGLLVFVAIVPTLEAIERW